MTSRILIFALLILQPVWHLWLVPSNLLSPVFITVFMLIPILPAAVLSLLGRPSASFWGGLAALLYFSHGVMEAWSKPAVATLAWIEVLLSVALVLSASWPGLRARRDKRLAASAEGSDGSA